MKKKAFLTMAVLYTAFIQAHAAGNIFGDISGLLDEIKSWAVVVIVGTFIVSGLFNLPNFIGEKRDIRAGVVSVLSYVAGVIIFMGVVTYLSTLSIS